MKTSLFKKGRVFSTAAKAFLAGAGSVLDISGAFANPHAPTTLARQDRDCRALQSDWQRIGGDIRRSMDTERERHIIRKKK